MTSAILSLTNLIYFYEKKMCLPLLYTANIRRHSVNRIEATLKNTKEQQWQSQTRSGLKRTKGVLTVFINRFKLKRSMMNIYMLQFLLDLILN